MTMIGESAGFTLRYVGLDGKPVGNKARAATMAACTSRAAPSILRSRSNCKVIFVEPCVLMEVISVTPAIRLRERSRGVAILDAIVSGLAPASDARTEIVGKSTCGSGATGSCRKPIIPEIVMATTSRVVAIGRSTKSRSQFTADGCPDDSRWVRHSDPSPSGP